MQIKIFLFSLALGGLLSAQAAAEAADDNSYAISIYGSDGIKHEENEPFPYVNPEAPKGGHITVHMNNFNTLNPYTLKGMPPQLLDLVFETPTMHSYADDEPFTEYGHLVESIELADDRMSLVYEIRESARFSDGEPVTADDFVFSFELTRDPQYDPRYKQYFAGIEEVEKLDDLTVRFHFSRQNQEIPLLAGQMPILPEHVYGAEGKEFADDFDRQALGSGPYVVDDYEFGKFIQLKRNPDWWGKDLAKARGMYNFETITAKVYRTGVSRKEAFKGGDFDVLQVNTAKDWALDFRGSYVQKNYIIREQIPHDRPSGMQGFAFNLRKPVFESHLVRYAIAMVMNFDWMNKNLFYNQYKRLRCFFENSVDMTDVEPPGGKMREYLRGLADKHGGEYIPKMAFTEPLQAPGTGKNRQLRKKQAELLLKSAGWRMGPDGIRYKNGRPLAFTLLLHDQTWERIAEPYKRWLAEIGVKMKIDSVQPAQYQKRLRMFDYDMIVNVYPHSRSIGNELTYYFSSDSAEVEGSRNMNGVQNPAIDEILTEVVAAETREELVFYGQALDRVLSSLTLAVPHWHLTSDRLLSWNKFGRPDNHCTQLLPEMVAIRHWWYDDERAEELKEKMADKEPMQSPD